MVEGSSLTTSRNDSIHTHLQILQNVPSPNPEHRKSLSFQRRDPRAIAFRPVATIVRLAIDLDPQSDFEAGEVDYVRSNRKLAAEAKTAGPFAQLLPQQDFGQAHVLAQAASCPDRLDRADEDKGDPSTMLRMVPLPVPGRNFGVAIH